MKKTFGIFLVTTVFLSCGFFSQDADFEKFSTSFFEKVGEKEVLKLIADEPENFQLYPKNWLPNSPKKKEEILLFLENTKLQLQKFDPSRLSSQLEEYYFLIEKITNIYLDFLENDVPENIDLYQPKFVLEQFYRMESSDLTLDEKLLKMIDFLKNHSDNCSSAIANLKSHNNEHTERAIQESIQTYFFLKNELPLLLKKSNLTAIQQKDFLQQNKNAQLATKNFLAFLTSLKFEAEAKN